MFLDDWLSKIFGTKHQREIKRLMPKVRAINELEPAIERLSDAELAAKTVEFRKRLAGGETLDDLLVEAFAAAREAGRRVLNMRHFDVQLIGGMVLHEGKIAEMKTGEGKTLVATLAAYLNALEGQGVHIVTVNDYLARRDSEWMGKLYKALGLTVGCIQNQMDNATRRVQYNSDITYGTNNEFGFDYLRDNMAIGLEDRVQRGHYYAIVDEVDSVLIDEARTPLIISGPVQASPERYGEMKPLVEQLVKKQTVLTSKMISEAEELMHKEDEYAAGEKLLTVQRGAPKNKRLLKLKKEPGMMKLIQHVETDYLRDKKLHELDNLLYYSIDEREHTVN